MTLILNSPTCKPCEGSTPGNAGVPPFYAIDPYKLTLLAGVSQTVTFTNIKSTSASEWSMSKPKCVNADGSEIYPTVTELANGFTVVADEDCTFSCLCVKLI